MKCKTVDIETKTITYCNDEIWAGEVGPEIDIEKEFLKDRVKELSEQINKMKNCWNCKFGDTTDSCLTCFWEMSE
jgi:hypothetical protein